MWEIQRKRKTIRKTKQRKKELTRTRKEEEEDTRERENKKKMWNAKQEEVHFARSWLHLHSIISLPPSLRIAVARPWWPCFSSEQVIKYSHRYSYRPPHWCLEIWLIDRWNPSFYLPLYLQSVIRRAPETSATCARSCGCQHHANASGKASSPAHSAVTH